MSKKNKADNEKSNWRNKEQKQYFSQSTQSKQKVVLFCGPNCK